ncbi:MAG: GAF domain-containing protein, partial [Chloroflexi bacterium]|nr:GAF domain-containing protein [Chloroflexota bacterium]
MKRPRKNEDLKDPDIQRRGVVIRNLEDPSGSSNDGRVSGIDSSASLQDLLDQARRLTGARYGLLTVFDDTGEIDQFLSSGITARAHQRIGPNPKVLGVLGLLEGITGPFNLADLQAHPQFTVFPKYFPKMNTFLGSAIAVRGQVIGNLYLAEKESKEPFTDDDELHLGLLCAQVGLVVHNLRLLQALENDRGLVESVLRKSPDDIYRSLVENAGDGIFRTSLEGRYLSANPSLARMYGYESPE